MGHLVFVLTEAESSVPSTQTQVAAKGQVIEIANIANLHSTVPKHYVRSDNVAHDQYVQENKDRGSLPLVVGVRGQSPDAEEAPPLIARVLASFLAAARVRVHVPSQKDSNPLVE